MWRHFAVAWSGCAAALAALLALAPGPALAQDANEYDVRVARTLFNTLRPGAVPPGALKPADLAKLDRFEKDPAGGKAVYVLKFGTVDGSGDTRGFYKIAINEELSEAKGWQRLGDDRATGGELFYRRVERSDADRFAEIGARKKVGNLIFSVQQRRPLQEAPADAAADAGRRLGVLLEQAKDNKLLSRLVLKLVTDSGAVELPPGRMPFTMPDRGRETDLHVRVELVDGEGKPLGGAEKFTLRLEGPLAGFVQVREATFNEKTNRYDLRPADEARSAADIHLRVKGPDDLPGFYKNCLDAKDQGIDLRISAVMAVAPPA